jgi:hypothetical protein
MPDNSIPWSPDNSVDYWTNLCSCMERKGMPFPPRDLFSNPDHALETLRSVSESVGEEARDSLVKAALKAKFGAEWMLEVIGAGEVMDFLAPAYYLTQLQDCVMRCNAMRPPPTVGNPLGNPGVADPGPRPDVWPTPPPGFVEPAPDPQPAIPMEDPAPARAKAGMSAGTKTVLVIAISAVGIGGALALGKSLPSNGGGGSGGAWYMHYSCGGDTTCIADPPPAGNGGSTAPGGNTGIIGANSSQSECEYALIPYENIGLAQSYWCDQSTDAAESS